MTKNDKIVVKLSAAQRDLLISIKDHILDDDVVNMFNLALKKETKYELYLAYDQLEQLIEWVSAVYNHEAAGDRSLGGKLERLLDYLERMLEKA